ncbi:hypothetical protein EVY06_05025 [Citrobacter koseri]|uniref:Uncharacterized protein n=1 Tax=Citrobacter koseri TaxID=545 RepID=A0AAQ0VAT8_CITKO|nr:hypothetical protein CO700_04920 [Citrobacter koseri]QCQ72444.1 hypothetical protein FD428_16105 [Citrobacter sp. TBCP-5362]AYY72390.1 hypothetical protein EGX86_00225 [Citrobacter koseri]MBE0025234.1 hypothetical protein [Citrobacter koseri]MBE0081101.1 hypothetical protein [Citrobacter koseri]
MLRLFSQFPANFGLNTVHLAQNSDKTKRPAGRFHIICSNILEKRQQLQMRFSTRCFLRHGKEAMRRSYPAILPTP